jgi:GUN4-like
MNHYYYGLPTLLFSLLIYSFSPSLERFHHGSSDRYIPYSKLEQVEKSLEDGNLIEADITTTEILFVSAGKLKQVALNTTERNEKVKNRWLAKPDIDKLSCQHLLKLDDIWTRKSKGKFGFTNQSKFWKKNQVERDIEGSEENFRKAVGWNINNAPTSSQPEGFFPYQMYQAGVIGVPFISTKLKDCQQKNVD